MQMKFSQIVKNYQILTKKTPNTFLAVYKEMY
jgi:hypothetical protein